MIDKYINIALLIFISFSTLCVIADRRSIKMIIGALLVGLLSLLLGVFLVFNFNGYEALTKMLKLQEVYINGKFIILGYGCFIGAIFSIFIPARKGIK